MSGLHNLLKRSEPLEAHEISELKDWLSALEEDVAIFGATPQDENLMLRIQGKIVMAGYAAPLTD